MTMKPMQSEVTRISRCPCCSRKYAKKYNQGSAKSGKSAARQKAKRTIRSEIYGGKVGA